MKKSFFSPETVTVLSLPIPRIDEAEAQSRLQKFLDAPSRCHKIYTPNPQMALQVHRTPALCHLFSRADLLLPDGVGLCIGARLLGTPLPCRIAGIDAGLSVLSMAEERGLSIALLGAKPGVAVRAAMHLKNKFPRLRICYTHHGYFDRDGAENEKVLADLKKAAPDILFVCFGFPAQEIWIERHADAISSLRLCMGLGGSLDVWAEDIRRAPRAISACGLEWLWRTLCQPQRAKIFLDIPHFLFLVLRQKREEKKEAAAERK